MFALVNIDNSSYNLCMRTGNYCSQLHGNLKYKAFIPSLLPFDVKMDATLLSLLSEADLALGQLASISGMIPDVDFFILMYIRKEATLSSQVEGTQATFSDALKAEAHIQDAETHNDVDEILNYIKAMNYGLDRLNTLPLSLRLIKEIHQILLQGVRGSGKSPGDFRKSQNWIGGPTLATATYTPPPVQEVMPLLDNLEKFFHEGESLPLLIRTGLIHAQFEAIHPFLDGNGRIGRLLIPFYLCSQGILKKPLLYLSQFFKQNRQAYYDKLADMYSKDNIEAWLKFFLTGVAETAKQATKTTQSILRLKEIDTQKILQLGRGMKNAHCLLERLYRSPLVRIKDIENITGLTNPNALVLASKFEALGILRETTGQKRNRVYQYEEYIRLFD